MTAKILPHNRFPSKTMTRSVSRDINRPNTPQTDAKHQASQQAQRLPSAPRSPLDTSVLEPYVPLVAAYGSSKPRGRAGWLRSPARVALKIRCRSRCTSHSQSDQSTQSQSTGVQVGLRRKILWSVHHLGA